MPAFFVNLAIYLVFLGFLTAFVVVLPIPRINTCDAGGQCDEGTYLLNIVHTSCTTIHRV